MILLLACTPFHDAVVCDAGLDANNDGFCDRDVADWSTEAELPAEGDRHNIYQLEEDDLAAATEEGLVLAALWPVDVSGLLLPADSFEYLFAEEPATPEVQSFQAVARQLMGFGTLTEMMSWIGVPPFPDDGSVPIPEGLEPGDPMGYGRVNTEFGEAVTFSCYACHATDFYGTTIVGMTNPRTRANEFFTLAQAFFPGFTPDAYEGLTGATAEQMELYARTQGHLPAIGGKVPQVRGLDTSLAQVGLSLARRGTDPWATPDASLEENPAESLLEDYVADSKPAVWWNLRYKTRWLSDGSIVSGNPIFTNFLWNELGRGTDLRELDTWMSANGRSMDVLTVAVFNTPAPRWSDVFPQYPIDEAKAMQGQPLFESYCATCHGSYEKGWDAADASALSVEERLATVRVAYSGQTQVLDVGTDGQRAAGMADFSEKLNSLAISQRMNTVVEVQAGYVPPPLDAVWARFPYLHNASVPSLCALLSPQEERPAGFWVGPPNDPTTDFDPACVGLPSQAPVAWTEVPEAWHDTTIAGLGNQGHTQMLAAEVLDPAGKAALIEFLKTL